MPVEIVTVPCRSDNYAYRVRDRATGRTALVDAPAVEPIVDALEARDWGLDQIWITHHHGDHTEGVDDLRQRYGAEVVCHPADRPITGSLYVRGREMRLCQEIVLGIGGVRALRTLSIHPAVWHMNEGHVAFLALERARERVQTGEGLVLAPRVADGDEEGWGRITACFPYTAPGACPGRST